MKLGFLTIIVQVKAFTFTIPNLLSFSVDGRDDADISASSQVSDLSVLIDIAYNIRYVFGIYKVLWHQIQGEVVAFIPAVLAIFSGCRSQRSIEIDLLRLLRKIAVACFYGSQCMFALSILILTY